MSLRIFRIVCGLVCIGLCGVAWAAPLTLRIADQKGNMRAQLEAANALRDLPYRIEWSEFAAAAPLAEALNAGAVDAGIIGDAPLLFAVAAGARVKAVAVDRSDPYGTAVLVREGAPLHRAADLKGRSIATGKGSIGHYVALRALQAAGLRAADVRWRFLAPADARMALASGDVDAWATWEPYTALAQTVDHARVLVDGRGLWAGNSFLAATDATLADPARRRALQDYLDRLAASQIWAYDHLDGYSRHLARIMGFPENVARLQFARRHLRWQALSDQTVVEQQGTADFYTQSGLLTHALDVKPTFDRGFTVR